MSILFGGREFVCDGCASIIPTSRHDDQNYNGDGAGAPLIAGVAPGVLVIQATQPVVTGTRRVRHFCPNCAGVAVDAFEQAFPRPPLVLNLTTEAL